MLGKPDAMHLLSRSPSTPGTPTAAAPDFAAFGAAALHPALTSLAFSTRGAAPGNPAAYPPQMQLPKMLDTTALNMAAYQSAAAYGAPQLHPQHANPYCYNPAAAAAMYNASFIQQQQQQAALATLAAAAAVPMPTAAPPAQPPPPPPQGQTNQAQSSQQGAGPSTSAGAAAQNGQAAGDIDNLAVRTLSLFAFGQVHAISHCICQRGAKYTLGCNISGIFFLSRYS